MSASPSPSPEASDEQVALGSVIDGRYRVDALLGKGGMGRVYRGEHTGIGRAVAIKVLHADLGRNREAAARFQREALASGRLDHPNIVGVSDFGVLDSGACFLVMEALEGESLGDRLERTGKLHWREAIAIMRGVLAGLAHAHDRGVVHRDIKPDNIFLARKDADVVVKILDFGIAKLAAGTTDDPASTRAGLTVGTPAYLSPEQAVGGEITPASDLYSATIVLFEMLAGRTPWNEKEPLAMLGAHISRPPPRIGEVTTDVEMPPGLEDLIQHGLVKTSADRIRSAGEYLAALDAICATAMPYGSAPIHLPMVASGPVQVSAPTPLPSAMTTPLPVAYTTPVPGSITMTPPPVSGAAPTAMLETGLPPQTRAVSLADAPAIPAQWIKRGGIALAAGAALAVVVALASGGSSSSSKASTAGAASSANATGDLRADGTSATQPDEDEADGSATAAVDPDDTAADPDSALDKDTRYKAALHDLQSAKTCAARKAAIPKLVELGDPRAIPHLKRARTRMRGGVLGIGSDNTNGCLVKAADAAIKALTPPKKK